jgi:hypothetical protein
LNCGFAGNATAHRQKMSLPSLSLSLSLDLFSLSSLSLGWLGKNQPSFLLLLFSLFFSFFLLSVRTEQGNSPLSFSFSFLSSSPSFFSQFGLGKGTTPFFLLLLFFSSSFSPSCSQAQRGATPCLSRFPLPSSLSFLSFSSSLYAVRRGREQGSLFYGKNEGKLSPSHVWPAATALQLHVFSLLGLSLTHTHISLSPMPKPLFSSSLFSSCSTLSLNHTHRHLLLCLLHIFLFVFFSTIHIT